ncbi:MAG: GNAT family N-acetyltransferase, partial [Kordiimonadaceae bacterium]|nr:GNAT family N-acetyltransferase [Kordiimonadaceae bacterium]
MDKNHIYLRALTPADWEGFRAIRIRAVNMHTGYVLVRPDKTEKQTPEYWKKMLNGQGKQVFGLFETDKLIGITAVFTWSEDPTGKTGIMAMIFIEPEYRGKGYSSLFYKA